MVDENQLDDGRVRCDACGKEILVRLRHCPHCNAHLGVNWKGILIGLGVLYAGCLAALIFRALDWFLFLAGACVMATVAALRTRSAERREAQSDPPRPSTLAGDAQDKQEP